MAFVRFLKGPSEIESLLLDKPKVSFGRLNSCDCVLRHRAVSRQHFFVERSGDKFLVVDQDSGNGTWVNGVRISWIELRPGDRIQAGPFELVFEVNEDGSGGRKETRDEGAAQAHGPEHKLVYPREYLEGIDYFNAGRYFDAHEVWEEIWLRSSGQEKLFYQMLIQTAVGLYHRERDNPRGVQGMYEGVTGKLALLPAVFMSVDLITFLVQVKEWFCPAIAPIQEAAPLSKPNPKLQLLNDV